MQVPTISDDTLQCVICSMKDDDPAVLLTQIMTFIDNLIPNHIWHRDCFQLTLSREQDNALECTMRVGDSVDDEWLVVFLLWQATQAFEVAASVYDADGQFLLIEAADALPSWITPENVENRVWMYQGHLHVVPLSCSSAGGGKRRPRARLNQQDDYAQELSNDTPHITPEDALEAIRNTNVETRLPRQAEDIIQARIAGYPAAAKTQVHRTKAALPSDIARALAANPHLIQKAVECFYTRDALQLRATQKMTRFPPSSSSVVTTRMTRTAYAQLMGQRFNAPRVFRRPLTQTTDESRWWDNGVKIACGFEMLYQEARTRKEGISVSGSEDMNSAKLDALRRDGDFVKYLARLEQSDYFKGEIRDSHHWKEKEKQAAKMWISMRQADDASRPSFAQLVNEALQTQSLTELKDKGEDPDDWLDVDPVELDRSLNRYQLKGETRQSNLKEPDTQMVDEDSNEDMLANEQARKLKKLAERMEGFVEGEGALEGALFEDDLLSDEEEDDLDSDEERANKKAAMDALVAPLEEGEYGKMPAEYRHGNSQAIAVTREENTVESTKLQTTQEPPSRPVRKPIFQRDRFDGVDSDDETSEEEIGGPLEDDDEDEEDRPQVVGDIEIDMEQEQEDFLRFSREALGIDDEAWASIIADREKRGVYVPPGSSSSDSPEKRQESKSSQDTPSGPSAARFFDEIPKIAVTSRPARAAPRTKDADDQGDTADAELNSFETVMAAMEKELERLKGGPHASSSPAPGPPVQVDKPRVDRKGKGKAKAVPLRARLEEVEEIDESEGEDEDIWKMQQSMDAELRLALKRDTEVVSSDEEGEDSEEEVPMDYNLIKNFLESFKSQQGLSGPVGGLAGRLQGSDWAFPRDG